MATPLAEVQQGVATVKAEIDGERRVRAKSQNTLLTTDEAGRLMLEEFNKITVGMSIERKRELLDAISASLFFNE